MSAMKRHMSRQSETWSVFLVALISVLLYAAWGAMVLGQQKSAAAAPVAEKVASR